MILAREVSFTCSPHLVADVNYICGKPSQSTLGRDEGLCTRDGILGKVSIPFAGVHSLSHDL
jgi:hypothetical protein